MKLYFFSLLLALPLLAAAQPGPPLPPAPPVPLPVLKALGPAGPTTKRAVIAHVVLPDNTAWFIVSESSEYDGGDFLVHLTPKGATLIGADTTVFPLSQWKDGPPPEVMRELAKQVMAREIAEQGGINAYARALTADALALLAPEQIAALRDLGVPLPSASP